MTAARNNVRGKSRLLDANSDEARGGRRRCRVTVACCGAVCLLLSASASAQVTTSFTEPFKQIEVAAPLPGVLARLDVKEGRRVEQGQVLAELDSRVLAQSRRLAELRARSTARVDAARADLKFKQQMLANLEPLLRDGHANHSEVERAEAGLEQALAALRLAEDQAAENLIELDRIDAEIEQRSIRSPIDGVVIEIHRRPGEYLPATDARLATVVALDQLRCRFFVDTAVAQQLSEGDSVDLRIGRQRQPAQGVVAFLSPITDSDSGTVRLDVVIDNRQGRHRSGVACELVTGGGHDQ